MSLYMLIGVLSGLITGAVAAAARRFVLWIIALPVLLAPIGHMLWWRDALKLDCLYAVSYPTDMCAQTRAFIETSLFGLPQAGLLVITHLLAAITLAIILIIVRRTINAIMDRPVRVAESESAEEELETDLDDLLEQDEVGFPDGAMPQPA